MAKWLLIERAARQMNSDMLMEIDQTGEVVRWFQQITETIRQGLSGRN
ncbi:MAG: hypothetical protein OXE94_10695 [Aestuariivita sp.]|nr:hypothetical protein [Aestuariivita sp.]MCY4203185.1 hypothetical protein [Aestuariivita sp.]MCY4287777.1 hypothetical protein [Aestuariivita sp.]MCY4345736.1 hypothetical protein [Aestuariivita sp.]